MKPGYIYIGLAANNLPLCVPYPHAAPFGTTLPLVLQKNAKGEFVGQIVGRASVHLSLSWEAMDCETWWELGRWFDENGPVFYCRYFDYNIGAWRIRLCYAEGMTTEPVRPAGKNNTTDYGKPQYLKNCALEIQDMGVIE